MASNYYKTVCSFIIILYSIAHNNLKLRPREHIPARCRFCDLTINPMTLKLLGDLDILKMYLYTENEVAMLRHSKLLTVDEIRMVNDKTRK